MLAAAGALRRLVAAKLPGSEQTFVRFHDERESGEEAAYGGQRADEATELRNVVNGKPPSYGGDGDGVVGLTPTGDDDGPAQRDAITEWQAGWNVTNAIQGMFIVTFPYAVLEGGYWALLAMAIVAYVCCYTGKILVECLYEPSASGVGHDRVRHTYVEVAEAVWGPTIGSKLVNAAQIIELLMTCILYVVLCGDLLVGSFPLAPVGISAWIAVCSALLLPCALLRGLRHVSFFSFWCTVAHLAINAVIVAYCVSRAAEWHWSAVQVRIDIWTFPISLGIIIFSYTSQIFLPTLEGNMEKRDRFHCMMHWTHLSAAIFKVVFSYVCFLTWGLSTTEVITNNLPNTTMRIVVNSCLVAKALLSYPLPYFAAVQLLEDTFFRDGRRDDEAGKEAAGDGGKAVQPAISSCFDADDRMKVWALLLRFALVGFTMFVAIFVPHFAALMGLIGSFTGNMLSLVWPCYFHLKLKGYSMRWQQKWADICIILTGFVCAVLGVYYSSHALVGAFRGYETRPFQGLQDASNVTTVH